jgi:hypothetical protein
VTADEQALAEAWAYRCAWGEMHGYLTAAKGAHVSAAEMDATLRKHLERVRATSILPDVSQQLALESAVR